MINNKGENNPMYGRNHSEETKKKIAESRRKYRRENHPNWKGGKRVNSAGYVEVRLPDHHRARKNGYVFEHIIVAEEKIGRKLQKNEHVHHINEVKTDNSPSNLMVIDIAEHSRIHGVGKRTGVYKKCIICNKEFYRKPSHAKRGKCCSHKCVGIYTNLKRKGEVKL
jgi:hypothetical protein